MLMHENKFLKMLQYSTKCFTKPEQCDRTKTDIFGYTKADDFPSIQLQKGVM